MPYGGRSRPLVASALTHYMYRSTMAEPQYLVLVVGGLAATISFLRERGLQWPIRPALLVTHVLSMRF